MRGSGKGPLVAVIVLMLAIVGFLALIALHNAPDSGGDSPRPTAGPAGHEKAAPPERSGPAASAKTSPDPPPSHGEDLPDGKTPEADDVLFPDLEWNPAWGSPLDLGPLWNPERDVLRALDGDEEACERVLPMITFYQEECLDRFGGMAPVPITGELARLIRSEMDATSDRFLAKAGELLSEEQHASLRKLLETKFIFHPLYYDSLTGVVQDHSGSEDPETLEAWRKRLERYKRED